MPKSLMYPSIAHDIASPVDCTGVYPRNGEVVNPLRPTLGLGGLTVAFFTAASYAAWMSKFVTPFRYASANATSELVPTMRSAYPGEDQRAIQPPSLYCWTKPSIISPALV